MVIMGNFLTMGATFLIIGMQKRAKKDQPGETTPDPSDAQPQFATTPRAS